MVGFSVSEFGEFMAHSDCFVPLIFDVSRTADWRSLNGDGKKGLYFWVEVENTTGLSATSAVGAVGTSAHWAAFPRLT